MSRPMFRVCVVALLAGLSIPVMPSRAQQAGLLNVPYEDSNRVDPKPVKLAMPHGTVQGMSGQALAQAHIGVFTEREHRLVATVATNDSGLYSLPQLPPGRYRLVAEEPDFCPANVPIRITGGFAGFPVPLRTLDLQLHPLDSCASRVSRK